MDIESVSLKVDMQTVSTKVQLTEFGGPDHILAAGDTLENVVHHEIKELGQHVLACTVTYRLPPHSRHAPGPAEDVSDPTLQTFRKFYKFAASLFVFERERQKFNSYTGYEPAFRQNKSACAQIAHCVAFHNGEGEDIPRGSHPKFDHRTDVVRTHEPRGS